LEVLFIRDVPVDTNALGEYALERLPSMKQVFVTPNSIMAFSRFEALVYLREESAKWHLKIALIFTSQPFQHR